MKKVILTNQVIDIEDEPSIMSIHRLQEIIDNFIKIGVTRIDFFICENDAYMDISGYTEREETDEEFEARKNKIANKNKIQKEYRLQQYLKLKKEFENI